MGTKILVVEDDMFVQMIMVAALAPHGHEITTATDGDTALAEAVLHPPDLVISDVMMPGLDGWALVRRVRAHPRLAFVPFIFLSSLNSIDDVLRGFRLGADDYLPKPFTTTALVERVTHALQRRNNIEHDARGLLAPRDDGEPSVGVRGSLAVVGLSSLLVLLDLEKKGGTLELTRSSPHERCRLLLREGRVFQAHVDVGPPLTHAEVIYHVLGWSLGSFEFHSGDIEVPDEIGCSTTGLLMEAARLADEQAPAIADSANDRDDQLRYLDESF